MPPKRAPRAPRTNTINSLVPYYNQAQDFFGFRGVGATQTVPITIPQPLTIPLRQIRQRQNQRDILDTYRQTELGDIFQDFTQQAGQIEAEHFTFRTGEILYQGAAPADIIRERLFHAFLNSFTVVPPAGANINRRMNMGAEFTTRDGRTFRTSVPFQNYTQRLNTYYDDTYPQAPPNATLDERNQIGIEQQNYVRNQNNLRNMVEKLVVKVAGILARYADEDTGIESAEAFYKIADYHTNILGAGVLKTQLIMNKEWFCPDVPSEKWCFYNAYTMGRCKTVQEVLAYYPFNVKKQNGERSKKWGWDVDNLRRKVKPHVSAKEMEYSSEETIYAMLKMFQIPIILHDQNGAVIREYTSTECTAEPIHIMFHLNHYIPMLPNSLRPPQYDKHMTILGRPVHADTMYKIPAKHDERPIAMIVKELEVLSAANDSQARPMYKKLFEKPKERVYESFSTFDIETCLSHKLKRGERSDWRAYGCAVKTPHLFQSFWGVATDTEQGCVEQMMNYLYEIRETFRKRKDKFGNVITHTMYGHNSGTFDMFFILNDYLLRDNSKWVICKEQIISNGRWLKMEIRDANDKNIVIKFQDSYAILPMKLDTVAREFECDVQKGSFDHSRITVDNWKDYKDECEPYLKADCVCLHQALTKYEEFVWDFSYSEDLISHEKVFYPKGGVVMSQTITAASISKKTFFNKFYDFKKHGICTLNETEYSYIKASYVGGRNETFVPVGETIEGIHIFYKDFTSLYPYVAFKNLLPYGRPMFKPLNNIKAEVNGTTGTSNIPFGFIRVMVKSLDFKRKPIHAVKEDNKCYFSYFKDPKEMVLYWKEIWLGCSRGMYEYTMLDCIEFESARFMKDFMKSAFDEKQKQTRAGNKGRAQGAKIVANSGYGFWALNLYGKEGACIMHKDEAPLEQMFADGQVLDIQKHNDYYVVHKQSDIESKDVNIAVASAITSLARCLLWELIDDVETEGGKVFYCDTDSIITNLDTDKNPRLRALYNPSGTGEELGELKDECYDKLRKEMIINKEDGTKTKMYNEEEIQQIGNNLNTFVCAALKCYAMEKTHPLMKRPIEVFTQKGGVKGKASDYKNAPSITVEEDGQQKVVKEINIFKDVFHRGGITQMLSGNMKRSFQLGFEKEKVKAIRFQYTKARLSAEGLILPFVWTQKEGFV